jgi:signal transduction histidine kinase/integral membrane sensor domain MASE1
MAVAAEAEESRLGRVMALAVAYFLTGKLGLLLAIPPGYATAVWPPSGIALAMLLVYGERCWPGVLLGSFLVNAGVAFDAASLWSISRSLAIATLIGAGGALQAVVGVRLIRRWVGYPTALDRERDVGLFLLLGGPLSCLINASWGVSLLSLAGEIGPGEFPFSWLTWWVGDAIGVVTVAPIVMVLLAEPRIHWQRRKLSMLLPLCITFALVVAFFVQVSGWERERIRREFVQYAEPVQDTLIKKLSLVASLEALETCRDLLAGGRPVGREEFRRFAANLLERHPEMFALAWLPVVRAGERRAYEAGLAAEGYGRVGISERDRQGRLVPAAARPEYVPATYIEPIASHGRGVGFDVASEPVRQATILKARDSGQAAMTAPLRLIQDERPDPSELVFIPVYAHGLPHETLAQRRAHIVGYVSGSFRLSSLIAALVRQVGSADMNVQLFDDSVPGGLQIYNSSGATVADADHAMEWTEHLSVAGRDWRLVVSPNASYLHRHRGWQGWSVLAAGLLFTSLLGALLLVITGGTTRVRMLVDQRTAELAEANRQLQDEVERRKQSEQELQGKNLELKEADLAKDRFLASMSHELRTPLNAIIGFTGTLLMKLAGPLTADQEKQLRTVQRNARHLLSLINDLLDLARIEAGKVQLRREPVVCAEVIEEVAATLRPQAEKKGLVFELQLPEEDIVLQTDRRAFAQIVINLVGNAIKFTEQGLVRVELARSPPEQAEDCIVVNVSDTGCGIAEQDLSRLFQSFTQLDPSSTRLHEGSGLGLHLSQRLAGLIGGRISCRSELGRGSTFTLMLGES